MEAEMSTQKITMGGAMPLSRLSSSEVMSFVGFDRMYVAMASAELLCADDVMPCATRPDVAPQNIHERSEAAKLAAPQGSTDPCLMCCEAPWTELPIITADTEGNRGWHSCTFKLSFHTEEVVAFDVAH